MSEPAIDIVLLGSEEPFDGDGQLWKATEGGPSYRRTIHVPNGKTCDVQPFREQGLTVWTGHQVFGEKQDAPLIAGSLLTNGQEGMPTYEQEFIDWIQTEHLPILANVPGTLYAARYEAIDSSPFSFAVYYLQNRDVMKTDEWKKIATPWRERIATKTQNRIRGLYDAVH